MGNSKDYSYIQPGYTFPISNIKCIGYEYSRRDNPNNYNVHGTLRHYVMVECPFCLNDFEGRLDRLEFNPNKQEGPRTLCCKKCSLTHKRPFKDPWRASEENHAKKEGANEKRINNLTGKYFGDYYVKSIDHTDNVGMVWYNCICSCGNIEVKRSNTITGTGVRNKSPRVACSKCLSIISAGELKIKKYLELNKMNFETQVMFDDLRGIKEGLLRFDFGIKNSNNEYKYLIEFQGEQHYKPIDYFGGKEQFNIQQEHDNRKRKWCKEHNIELIEIPYYYKNIEDYLQSIFKSTNS